MTDEKKPKGKTALPKDWAPSDSLRSWARVNAKDVDLHGTLLEFRDYCAARDWRMSDWDATFRNWLRKADKAARGKNPLAGAEKARPIPEAVRLSDDGPQRHRWKAALNRLLLQISINHGGKFPPGRWAYLLELRDRAADKLMQKFGDVEVPIEVWRPTSERAYEWLSKAADTGPLPE